MPYGRRKTYSRRRSTNTGYRRRTLRPKSRYASRKRYYRPRNTGVSRSLRAKWLNPISPKQLVKFVYADSSFSRTLNVGNGYSSYYVFRAISPYDPDYTGVGAQPYGFDELCSATMYSNFRATASAIRVYFRPESTYASMRRLHAFIIPFTTANPILTDISDVRMIPHHVETTYDGNTESTKGARMKHYLSTRKVIPNYNDNNVDFQGTYASNPSIVWYWLVYFYAEEFDDEEVDIYFDVKIKYYTVMARYGVPNES